MAAVEFSPPSARTTVKRRAPRGVYDPAAVHAILDEALICHVAHVVDGSPVVLPTIHGRIDNDLYVHGSVASRMLRTLAGGIECCVTATVIDGLVLARSAFHHSMNSRSVVLLGTATKVEDDAEKRHAFEVIVEHVLPGRTQVARAPNDNEVRTTLVLRLPITEGSAKVREGGPTDDPEDMDLPVWAGVVPLRLTPSAPRQDAGQPPNLPEPVVTRP